VCGQLHTGSSFTVTEYGSGSNASSEDPEALPPSANTVQIASGTVSGAAVIVVIIVSILVLSLCMPKYGVW